MIHKYLIDQSIQEPERQAIELNKLQAMINYCFCSTCLRRYMLNYFGEQVSWNACHNCSSCEGQNKRRDGTAEAKAVFRAVMATEERFGAAMIADILAGETTERIEKYGFHHLPVFGALRQMEEREVKGLIRQLTAEGYLHSALGKYPTLSLTAGAEAVLAGTAEVTMAVPEVAEVKRSRTKKGAAYGAGRSDGGLFERLREHRRRLAQEEGVPPYLIFPDTVLIDMAGAQPRTLADMYGIKGIGEVKLKKYGLSFLQVVGDYKKKENRT